MRRTLMVLLIAASLGVAACASKPRQQDAPADAGAASGSGVDTAGVDDSAAAGSVAADDGAGVPGPQEGLLARRVIYFDFDSSEIRGEATEIIAAHARYLASRPGTRVRLEGHTDERGSREYNIALGERRAQAVRRALMLQGAADTQLSTVSYGEERPAAAGSNEEAWAQNRRVEIVYLN
ncbi:MAG: peptidoglycan-associated lipoprotein Pal [Pseudomonadota bacterium]|nr:MAG: peptidoglycan-associated lipoprotein Pal [Pseudomonadota bacterium]